MLGNESPETGLPKLDALERRHAESASEKDIERAFQIVSGR
jgi:hypothetical protein